MALPIFLLRHQRKVDLSEQEGFAGKHRPSCRQPRCGGQEACWSGD